MVMNDWWISNWYASLHVSASCKQLSPSYTNVKSVFLLLISKLLMPYALQETCNTIVLAVFLSALV